MNSFLEIFSQLRKKSSSFIIRDEKNGLNYSEIISKIQAFTKLFKDEFLKEGDLIILKNPQQITYIPFLLSAFEYGLTICPIYEKTHDKELFELSSYLKNPSVFDLKTESLFINTLPYSFPEPGFVFQSSGTTGRPKLFFQSRQKILLNAEIAIRRQKINSQSLCYSYLSVSHTGGVNMQFIPALLSGGAIYLDHLFQTHRYIEKIKKLQPSHTILLPCHYRMLKYKNKLPFFRSYNKKMLVLTGSEPISNEFYSDIGSQSIIPLGVYGMTEVGPFICRSSSGQPLLKGAVSYLGVFEEEYQARINTKSEIEVLGPGINNKVIISGDHLKLSENVSTYFPTKDYGLRNKDQFYFKGRVGTEINLAGYKFSTKEVEQALLKIPEIKHCLVYKEKDKIWNEIPHVKIQLNKKISKQEIIQKMRQSINSLKIPRKIEFVKELSKTSLNKVKM